MLIELLLGAILGLVIFSFAWFAYRGFHRPASPSDTLALQFDRFMQQVDRRLAENSRAMQATQSFVTDRLSASEKAVREVSQGLGKLESATAALQRTNDEIASFQQLLRHPKIRGGFGEVLLGHLLADTLPKDRYQTQYTFHHSGEIADAVIFLQDNYLVAIDAKFPLANYQLFSQATDENQKKALHKAFIRDVKKHIADISRKYIVPDKQTLDYAFMYVPVETIYYEIMVHDAAEESVWEYCLAQKVIPVSPNSFLAYLQTVLVGLRGLRIEEQAKEILQALSQVRRDFQLFAKDYTMIGTHLNNAKNRYDDTARRLDRLSTRFDHIETNTAPQISDVSPTID